MLITFRSAITLMQVTGGFSKFDMPILTGSQALAKLPVKPIQFQWSWHFYLDCFHLRQHPAQWVSRGGLHMPNIKEYGLSSHYSFRPVFRLLPIDRYSNQSFSPARITSPYHQSRFSRNFHSIHWSWDATPGRTQHLFLHCHMPLFIAFYSRPALKTIEDDTAVDFEFETFVDVPITKKASCGTPLNPSADASNNWLMALIRDIYTVIVITIERVCVQNESQCYMVRG